MFTLLNAAPLDHSLAFSLSRCAQELAAAHYVLSVSNGSPKVNMLRGVSTVNMTRSWSKGNGEVGQTEPNHPVTSCGSGLAPVATLKFPSSIKPASRKEVFSISLELFRGFHSQSVSL